MITDLQRNNAFFRQLLFLGVLIFIGLVIFRELAFFIGAFLGAITMYVVVRHLFFTLTERYKWKPWFTALVFIFGMAVIILGIGFLVFEVTAAQIPSVDTSNIAKRFTEWINDINKMLGVKVITEEFINESAPTIKKFVGSIFNTTYSFAANIFMMLVILYFMLVNARKMERKILAYQPFHGKSLEMIKRELKNMIYSNAVAIPIVMFGQAMVAALIYWLLGIDNFVFWAFLTALCGLIPMIGTAIVSIPLAIVMMVNGQVWQGVVMILCGLFVIANVDNLIRIVFMKKIANTAPLVVIFGVILGIPLFGFWGIIFGPLLISGFMLLIKIYYHEYDLLTPCDPADPGSCDRDGNLME